MGVCKKMVIYLGIKTPQKKRTYIASRNDCKYTWEKTTRISCHNFETNGRPYPPSFKIRQGSIVSGMEGLCILLRQLAYPCRFGDMVPRFGKPVPVLSMVTNHVTDYIYTIHGHRITRWNDALLNQPALDTYARSVHAKGAALQNCFGFVDGTVIPIARPDEH